MGGDGGGGGGRWGGRRGGGQGVAASSSAAGRGGGGSLAGEEGEGAGVVVRVGSTAEEGRAEVVGGGDGLYGGGGGGGGGEEQGGGLGGRAEVVGGGGGKGWCGRISVGGDGGGAGGGGRGGEEGGGGRGAGVTSSAAAAGAAGGHGVSRVRVVGKGVGRGRSGGGGSGGSGLWRWDGWWRLWGWVVEVGLVREDGGGAGGWRHPKFLSGAGGGERTEDRVVGGGNGGEESGKGVLDDGMAGARVGGKGVGVGKGVEEGDAERKQTICIIGAGGFIGSHLLEDLMYNSQHKVLAIDVVCEKILHLLKPGQEHSPRLEMHKFNINDDPARLEELVKRSDLTINLAAICNPSEYNTRPIDTINSNFTHALPVVRMCADYDVRLIHFSTCEVYGKTLAGFDKPGTEFSSDPKNWVLDEETTHMIMGPVHKQRWSYACAKQLLERVIYAEGMERGLKFTIVRPFNWIGPRMDYIPGVDGDENGLPRVLANFSTGLMKGEPLKLVDGGEQLRTFIYVKDAIAAVRRMIEMPDKANGQIFNVGNGENEISVKNLAALMKEVYEKVSGVKGLPEPVVVDGETFYGAGYDDSDKRIPSQKLISTQLGWQPTTPLRDALLTTLDYIHRTYAEALKGKKVKATVLPTKEVMAELEKLAVAEAPAPGAA
eukprot:jgi/Mesvir1/27003/Mv20711-RA.1